MARETERETEREPDRHETEAERIDRNLDELLQELRVASIGVQVLFGFLLALPFSVRFATLDDAQRALYLVDLLLAALAIALLIGPAAQHRIVFRKHKKAELLARANVMAIAGFLALALRDLQLGAPRHHGRHRRMDRRAGRGDDDAHDLRAVVGARARRPVPQGLLRVRCGSRGLPSTGRAGLPCGSCRSGRAAARRRSRRTSGTCSRRAGHGRRRAARIR